eukprot:2667581-Pyramimonas_sp.AAC.1
MDARYKPMLQAEPTVDVTSAGKVLDHSSEPVNADKRPTHINYMHVSSCCAPLRAYRARAFVARWGH